ncbi:unnamed protein product [Caenorhabditis angaria]|uniref:Uncharacterized protein n=1 Tax=Caenorhabditis angaria TaxID=860376 RepID=A0A9P1IIK5_9PELO|nr:unnamed protein product [Caenorhabditis angaria]
MVFEYYSTSGIVFVDISGKLDYLQVAKDFRWKWKIQADSDFLKRRQYSVIMNVEAQQSDDSQNNTRILRFSRSLFEVSKPIQTSLCSNVHSNVM